MSDENQTKPSLISEDMTIDGNIDSTGVVHIHGCVNGNVSAAKLSLEASGNIKGNVTVESADLLGNQRGKVVSRSLKIHSGATLKGAVVCQELTVESGAFISGKFQVGPK